MIGLGSQKKYVWNASMIRKGFLKVYHWIGMYLTWKVGNGENVLEKVKTLISVFDFGIKIVEIFLFYQQ